MVPMNRRNFINATGVSILTILSGCESEDKSNITVTTNSKNQGVSTHTTADTSQTVKNVIVTSRQRLKNALLTLNNMDVIENDEIGIATKDNFEKYRNINEKEVIGPANEARRMLEGIREDARGEDAATGKMLLGISVYTNEKWKEYSDIVRSFTAFTVSLEKISESDTSKALDAAQDAMTLLEDVKTHRSQLITTLRRIRSTNGDSGLTVWSPRREASELEVLGVILNEMLPTFGGLRSFVNGIAQAGKAVTLIQNGKYTEAMHFATSARANIDNATSQFRTALDRNVRYYGGLVETFKCQSAKLYGVTATLVDAIQKYQDGNKSKGNELLSNYRDKSTRAIESCSNPTPTTTTTSGRG